MKILQILKIVIIILLVIIAIYYIDNLEFYSSNIVNFNEGYLSSDSSDGTGETTNVVEEQPLSNDDTFSGQTFNQGDEVTIDSGTLAAGGQFKQKEQEIVPFNPPVASTLSVVTYNPSNNIISSNDPSNIINTYTPGSLIIPSTNGMPYATKTNTLPVNTLSTLSTNGIPYTTKTNTLPINTLSTPSTLSTLGKIRILFKLNVDYPPKDTITNVINQINTELVSQLFISPDRFQNMRLYPGSIYVSVDIYPEKFDSLSRYPNNNVPPLLLYQILNNIIKKKLINKDKYPYLGNADSNFGVKIVKDTQIYIPLASIIPKKASIIDMIVKNNYSFALSANVINMTIPSDNNSPVSQKMYLTVPISINENKCDTDNGMLKFNDILTQGGVFNINPIIKNFKYNSEPYKYIDFEKIIYNNDTNNVLIQSIFYNLYLKLNNNSVTYCEKNCDISNPNGFCSQEEYNNKGSEYTASDNSDPFNIKNLIKFRIEADNSVTPYFISLAESGLERIYFITNNYSTITAPSDYKTIVQVPTYTNSEQYYKTPEYNQGIFGDKSLYTYKNIPILNLSPIYTDAELENYKTLPAFPISQTLITKSDAYNNYAYNFQIEIISDDNFNNLSLN